MNNLISEISDILFSIGIPYETGVFHEPFPPEYAVITPLSDTFEYFLDDAQLHSAEKSACGSISRRRLYCHRSALRRI